MTPPGRRSPRSSASLMMYSAARSLTEPPGLRNSALPRIVHPVSSEARRSFIRGVLPTEPTKPSRISMPRLRTGARCHHLRPTLSGCPDRGQAARPRAAKFPASRENFTCWRAKAAESLDFHVSRREFFALEQGIQIPCSRDQQGITGEFRENRFSIHAAVLEHRVGLP